MLNQDDDFDNDEDLNEPNRISRKKILVFLIPALIAIGLGVGFFYAFNHKFGNNGNANYSIVRNIIEEDGKEAESVTVFYDLPEITARLKDTSADEATARLRISVELNNVEDVAKIEALLPRINDVVIAHTIELTPDELESAIGLYWLKEELLYRINLLTSPLQVSNLNFKNFEIQKPNEK